MDLSIGCDDRQLATQVHFLHKASWRYSHQLSRQEALRHQIHTAFLVQIGIRNQLPIPIQELILDMRVLYPGDVLQDACSSVQEINEIRNLDHGSKHAVEISVQSDDRRT